ncbi:hypothetical protein [Nocardia terpenica]|uniref:Uncharacterized protein n=1 Tax=Nocardia terpenica TaxID=455432 RepID=A0A164PML7_9NOCA|nr:hypothetical protein [Nocardia terpenica]KZM75778.1 hypothetical protein AWN90_20800 [Nocardia terpenica]NQE86296.1 hypothetical protein [Nocardia terpenica]
MSTYDVEEDIDFDMLATRRRKTTNKLPSGGHRDEADTNLVREYVWLTQGGTPIGMAARQLGYDSVAALERALHRAGFRLVTPEIAAVERVLAKLCEKPGERFTHDDLPAIGDTNVLGAVLRRAERDGRIRKAGSLIGIKHAVAIWETAA